MRVQNRTETLYRASDDDFVRQGTSFAEDLETAKLYQTNRAYGGSRLWRARVAGQPVVDLRMMSTAELTHLLDENNPGAIGVDEWLPQNYRSLDKLRKQGALWALVDESYPSGSTTWIWLGDVDDIDDEPEMEEITSNPAQEVVAMKPKAETIKDSRRIGKMLGVDFKKININQFARGIEVEKEHATTVGGDTITIALIALDHLNEMPDYYTRLDKMEAAGEKAKSKTKKRTTKRSKRNVKANPISDGESCEVLVRGDALSFELVDGREIVLPPSYGLIHDPTGKCINRCDIRIGKCTRIRKRASIRNSNVASIAREYFGKNAQLSNGVVEIPNGPWQRVGRVVRIYYTRYGKHKGKYQHPFEEPMLLEKQKHGNGFRLRLPDRCVVDAHGFVWP